MAANEKLQQFKQEIFQLVSENKIPEAIGKLMELYKSPDGTYFDDILLLSRQYKDLTDRQMSGLVDEQDGNIEENKISHGLIHIINNLHTDPAVAKHFGMANPTPTPVPASNQKDKKKPWIWIVPIILSLFLLFFVLRNPTSETDVVPEIIKTKKKEGKATNENKAATGKIDIGKTLAATLQNRKDQHNYHFTAAEDGRVNVSITSLSNTLNPILSIYNPDGNRMVGTSAAGDGENIATWFHAQKDKTYRIVISNRNDNSGAYNLSLSQ